jgi:glucose 1-dehydrogenase
VSQSSPSPAVTRIFPRLQGRFALVTGASRGIGRAVAVRFAEEGATVAINYSGSEDAAKETLDLVREATARSGTDTKPAGHLIVQADVGDERAALAMVDDMLGEWGRLDILVKMPGFSPRRTANHTQSLSITVL